ncbi:adenine nucleotide alpha hydrolases-like protein [Tothia fuscella]|uniref:FAD synthase n=1 Tax=Tothia fuscella TaxID=1048955 RepID=A0A9P4NJS4_9PEZI|nr:adenine nucleotide alpha hydrolases-like protein [Tothia fuscella]
MQPLNTPNDSTTTTTNTNGHPVTQPPPYTEPLLPSDPISLPELCERVHGRVTTFLDEDVEGIEYLASVQRQIRISLGVIGEAFEKYSLPERSLAYNGGKDCLVLLILYLCALHTHTHTLKNHPPTTTTTTSSTPTSISPIQTVYIVSSHPFPEVEDFVRTSSATCSLSLSRYAKGMKEAFTDYLHDFPDVKAIFVGTRRTDPHGEHLTHFDQTDGGWPDFMRVHPVIDWHYVDIWTFIRHLNIPYCPLYDMGYTSLGGTTDTHRNPVLRRQSLSESGTPKVEFRPAYELVEDEEERLGRDWEKRAQKGAVIAPIGDDTENAVDDG